MTRLPLVLLAFLSCLPVAAAQVKASFTPFGTGCSNPNSPPPSLTATQLPVIGGLFRARLDNVNTNGISVVIAGASDKQWGNLILPVNMGFLGGANCTLYVSGECIAACSATRGNLAIDLGVPNDNSLSGVTFYMQCWSRDPGSNASGFAMSNAAKVVIGR